MDSEMGLSGKTVLVVGTGISGIAAVNLLATQSANIILLDGNTELSPETVAAKFSEDIHYDLILGDLPDQVMDRIDLAVLSPGVPTDLPFVVRMQEAGIPIWGDNLSQIQESFRQRRFQGQAPAASHNATVTLSALRYSIRHCRS